MRGCPRRSARVAGSARDVALGERAGDGAAEQRCLRVVTRCDEIGVLQTGGADHLAELEPAQRRGDDVLRLHRAVRQLRRVAAGDLVELGLDESWAENLNADAA